jgi:hypothetical protein
MEEVVAIEMVVAVTVKMAVATEIAAAVCRGCGTAAAVCS